MRLAKMTLRPHPTILTPPLAAGHTIPSTQVITKVITKTNNTIHQDARTKSGQRKKQQVRKNIAEEATWSPIGNKILIETKNKKHRA